MRYLAIIVVLSTGLVWQPPATTPAAPSLQIVTDGPLCTCVVGAAHTHVFTAQAVGTNGPFAWSVSDGALAPGKTLQANGLTAMIRGVATEPGVYQFTLAVRDVNNPAVRAERSYSVELLPQKYERPARRMPAWLPVVGGSALALSFIPLLRRRRPKGELS